MTKHKRTIWDDLVEIGNQILDKIDEVMNPDHPRKQPVRVPVPVRREPPRESDYNTPR